MKTVGKRRHLDAVFWHLSTVVFDAERKRVGTISPPSHTASPSSYPIQEYFNTPNIFFTSKINADRMDMLQNCYGKRKIGIFLPVFGINKEDDWDKGMIRMTKYYKRMKIRKIKVAVLSAYFLSPDILK